MNISQRIPSQVQTVEVEVGNKKALWLKSGRDCPEDTELQYLGIWEGRQCGYGLFTVQFLCFTPSDTKKQQKLEIKSNCM